MGPLKPSDAKSAKYCETPKSAMKKANEKASSSAARLQSTTADDSTTADTNIATTAGEIEGYAEGSTSTQGSPVEEKNKKLISKGSVKKAKAKSIAKPSARTVSRRQATVPAEPLSLSESDALYPVLSQATTNPRKEAVDSFDSPRFDSIPSKYVASPSSLFQPNQSVNQSSDRIAIFIDGSNLFYAASHLNIEVDYRRLLSSLVRGRRLLRAYFYTGVDPQNEKQRGFLLWLNRHGHRVVSKELTHLPDGSRKANMHVEMAVDMMRISEYCPNITLLGGDGNLAYALEVLSQRGTFIEVVSLQSMTSDSLIDLADSYTDLADLRDEIKR